MSESPSPRAPQVAPPGERPERPWGYGIGILVLGLFVSSVGNAVAMHDPQLQAVGNAVYPLGLLVAGWGVHRLIWVGPSTRPAWQRVLVTALVTLPAFALAGTLLSFAILLGWARFG
jgi:uncharacterized BrkB/YihY/UPF0761 family membrane protein